jgi:hypothetical protein
MIKKMVFTFTLGIMLFFNNTTLLSAAIPITGTAYVDNIQMTVYYTEAAAPAPSIKAHFGGGRIGAGRF